MAADNLRVRPTSFTAGIPAARQHRSGGFTLIEVLLAVTLVAILAMVAMPVYSSYRDRVRSHSAAQDIVIIAAGVKMYRQDVGAYPASLTDIGMAGKKDPWERPYQYYNVEDNGRGGARKDHALNPINTDFDLYSMGPDGETKKQVSQKDSVDDIIRGRNGAYIGVAADF